jgi:hypothetical protein
MHRNRPQAQLAAGNWASIASLTSRQYRMRADGRPTSSDLGWALAFRRSDNLGNENSLTSSRRQGAPSAKENGDAGA